MKGRGYVIHNGESVNQWVSNEGGYRAARAAKKALWLKSKSKGSEPEWDNHLQIELNITYLNIFYQVVTDYSCSARIK